MSEILRKTLEDIRRKLIAGIYQNEEHVRLSVEILHRGTKPQG